MKYVTDPKYYEFERGEKNCELRRKYDRITLKKYTISSTRWQNKAEKFKSNSRCFAGLGCRLQFLRHSRHCPPEIQKCVDFLLWDHDMVSVFYRARAEKSGKLKLFVCLRKIQTIKKRSKILQLSKSNCENKSEKSNEVNN